MRQSLFTQLLPTHSLVVVAGSTRLESSASQQGGYLWVMKRMVVADGNQINFTPINNGMVRSTDKL
jgi:hypothetical protein